MSSTCGIIPQNDHPLMIRTNISMAFICIQCLSYACVLKHCVSSIHDFQNQIMSYLRSCSSCLIGNVLNDARFTLRTFVGYNCQLHKNSSDLFITGLFYHVHF